MKEKARKYWKLVLSLIFGLTIYYFWAFPYHSVLSFQEQYQLFLTTENYFLERVAQPGGMASYLGEFLTQFYYLPKIGAISIALLFIALQRLSWRLAHRNGADERWYPLTFVSPIVLWAYMGDENVMLAFVISMLASLWMMLHYNIASRDKNAQQSKIGKWGYIVLGIPMFYWLFGPSVILVVIYVMWFECIFAKNSSCHHFAIAITAVVITIGSINLSSFVVQYPIDRLYWGLEYYRYPVYQVLLQYLVMAITIIMPIAIVYLPKSSKAFIVDFCAVAISVIVAFLTMGYKQIIYDIIEYDYLVRTEKWERIIEKAEKRQPSTPKEVASVNLALSQTGQLCERMFEFFQNGGEGLIPKFKRDISSPIISGEVFFRLGMINDAERYMYEAQEAMPNYRKSGRLTKRITECEIANGNFAVAAKYLRRLQNTIFYKPWATKMLALIKNPDDVAEHPLFKSLRANRYTKEDYLFSDVEMDQMLGLQFTCNNHNRMAYEYLMCYVLLERDIAKFMKYYPLGQQVGYDHIPRVFQQVIIGSWMQKHNDLRSMPYGVDSQVVNETVEFVRLYMSKVDKKLLDAPPYCYNAWHYILQDVMGKDKREKEEIKEIY